MSALESLPFDVLIEKTGTSYRARVIGSPAGEARADFVPPFAPDELETFLARVGRRGPISGSALKPIDLVKQFGGKLFDAVFHDEVLTGYRRSRDAAERAKQGLRVRLRLNDVPELADLPWEYLYDASRAAFLALSQETPIVRYLELPEPIAPLAAPSPINLLAVLASPNDLDALDVEDEWSRLTAGLEPLRKQGKITLTRVEPPTVEALQAALRRSATHVFHFIGHGKYSKLDAYGSIVLSDDEGASAPLDDEALAALLANAGTLRLAVLNACEGARTSPENPFVGVAPRLVQQGIAAVLAMQFSISDPAAIQFSTEFYRALADGVPVDAALTEARLAIYLSGNVLEWGTPALFMRSDNGMLFSKERAISDEEPKRSGHGGVNITGGNVSAGRDLFGGDRVTHGDSFDAAGDINTVTIGAGAQVGQAAAGRDIYQASGGAASEANELAQKLLAVNRALQDARGRVDPSKLALAEFQLQLLQNELTKSDAAPSGSSVTSAVDGLLNNVPALREPLAALLKSSEAQRKLAQAGVSDWVKQRFG